MTSRTNQSQYSVVKQFSIKVFYVLPIFILALVLGGCAYNPFLEQQPQDTVQTPQPDGKSGDQSIKEESKLYSQPEGEYFFRYPSDWQAVDVNEHGENYIVTTRISSTTEPPVVIEIGQFTGKEEFNDGNIVRRTRDMQRFYDSQKLISVTEIENGKAWYVELVFSEDNRDTALIGIPKFPKGFFINVKEGWQGNRQRFVEQIIGSFGIDKNEVSLQPVTYCTKKQPYITLETERNALTNNETQIIIRVLDRATQSPISGVNISASFTSRSGVTGVTDNTGEFIVRIPYVPSSRSYFLHGLSIMPREGAEHTISRINYIANAVMRMDVYLNKNENLNIVFDNPTDDSAFAFDVCR